MQFALGNGERQEAQPNLSGECRGRASPKVAKCGEVKIWQLAQDPRATTLGTL